MNGGATWINISQIHSNGHETTHTDQHAFAFVPGSWNSYFLGNDGGAYSSTNGTALAPLNQYLAITEFYRGAVPPTGKTTAVGGTQDTATVSYTGNASWYRGWNVGDAGYAAIDYSNSNNVYAAIASTTSLQFGQSSNGVNGPFGNMNTGLGSENHAFTPPLVMDPGNPAILYTGTTYLYQWNRATQSWGRVGGGNAVNFGSDLSAIAIAPSSSPSSRTIYVGTATGTLRVSTDGGNTFPTTGTGLPSRYLTAIAVSPVESSVAYATFSGFDSQGGVSGHVFKTTNGGASWIDVSGTGGSALPDAQASAVQIHPTQQEVLYLATDVGVFMSTSGGSNWISLSPGNNGMPPGVVIDDVVLNRSGTELFAFSHGRSAYVSDVSAASSTVWAWGDNAFEQLGSAPGPMGTCTGGAKCATSPVETVGSGGVGNLSNITAVSGGNNHSIALDANGNVWAWGDNSYGQLGATTTSTCVGGIPCSTTGIAVQGLSGTVAAIAGGGFDGGGSHSLAILSNNTVEAWGENLYGQLGNGTFNSSANQTPAVVSGGLTGITGVSGGAAHSLASKTQ